jgi:hypothetical protein
VRVIRSPCEALCPVLRGKREEGEGEGGDDCCSESAEFAQLDGFELLFRKGLSGVLASRSTALVGLETPPADEEEGRPFLGADFLDLALAAVVCPPPARPDDSPATDDRAEPAASTCRGASTK